MANLTMLGSNTFSCRYDESDLPENDPNREKYHCGSNTFDTLSQVDKGVNKNAKEMEMHTVSDNNDETMVHNILVDRYEM